MQSTCPLQVGLSVTLEHKYWHRELLNMVSKLVFCSSYSNKYRANATHAQGNDHPGVTRSSSQYQSHNVDHASRTLDGYGSVHIVGQVATFTPTIKIIRQIPRLKCDMGIVKRLTHINLVDQKKLVNQFKLGFGTKVLSSSNVICSMPTLISCMFQLTRVVQKF